MENLNINPIYLLKNNDVALTSCYKTFFGKSNSTKSGNNPKDIAKRRKKNKNKKTHRR